MADFKHSDEWLNYWDKKGIDGLRHSFLENHYLPARSLATFLKIPWPEPAAILTDIGMNRWKVSAIENVVSQMETKLRIGYKSEKPDVRTEEGIQRWVMKNLCNRLKNIEDKINND